MNIDNIYDMYKNNKETNMTLPTHFTPISLAILFGNARKPKVF